jgi:hypothetical protein
MEMSAGSRKTSDFRTQVALGTSLSIALFALATGAAEAAPVINLRNLVISELNYTGSASTVTVGQTLPTVTSTGAPIKAIADGSFANVFNNATADANFGVTAPITLEYLNVANSVANTTKFILLPTNQITGSFSSKSEGALNLSSDGKSLTIGGYAAGPNLIDVSNSNTPNHVDPTNPDRQTFQRAIGQINADGTVQVTNINAYSGDNIRAAILAGGKYYTVGNSNNGTGTPATVTGSTGVEMTTPGGNPETTKIGAFISGFKDKAGKADNYRGLTVFDNTLYVTKGSGSNGVDTVYQVGAAGTLPTDPNAPISILPGFPTDSAKTSTDNFYPFGLWFANSTTLYVADEGTSTPTANAGLEKWSLVNGTWDLDYVIQSGLDLGVPYTVSGSVMDSTGTITPSTMGLRNITGTVNADGTVSIFGITSTFGGLADDGANPNKLVGITDVLSNMRFDPTESFTTLKTASYGEVLRGVSLSPTPEPATWLMLVVGFGAIGTAMRQRRNVNVSYA